MNYYKISRYENDKFIGSCVQEQTQLITAIDAELFDITNFANAKDKVKLIIEVIDMSEEEYEKIRE